LIFVEREINSTNFTMDASLVHRVFQAFSGFILGRDATGIRLRQLRALRRASPAARKASPAAIKRLEKLLIRLVALPVLQPGKQIADEGLFSDESKQTDLTIRRQPHRSGGAVRDLF
jgi:hypothetical protein